MPSARWVPRAIALLVVVPCATGCDVAAEQVVQRAAEEDLEIEADDGGVTVRGRGGETTIGPGTDLPERLPDSLPLPADLDVIGSISQEDEGQVVVGVTAFATGSYEGLTAFFDERLPATDWTVVAREGSDLGGVRGTIWTIEGHGFSGTVTATELADAGTGASQLSVAVSLESR